VVDYFKLVNEREEQNIKLSQRCFSQDLQKYKLSVNVLAQTLKSIEQAFKGKVLQPETKIATVLVSSRFMVSSKCLFNMVVQGYYYDAWIVLRSLQENVFYCLCFAESNDYAKRWFKKQSEKKNELRLKEVKRVIELSSKPHVWEAYSFMSDFVHSNMPAIARIVEFERKPKIRPPDSPKFRKDSNVLLKAFRVFNISMLLVLIETFKEELSRKTKSVIAKFAYEEQRNLGIRKE